MKGLAILLVLATVIAVAMFALLQDSDRDMVRIEDEIAETLDRSSDQLADATRTLSPLRVINPTAMPLDNDLGTLRTQLEALRIGLGQLREARPESESQRGNFLKERRDARDVARSLLQESSSLVARSKILELILRDTQPKVQSMLSLMGMVSQARTKVDADGELEPTLATKLDQLQKRVGDTRQLAAETRRVAMVNAQEATTMQRAVSTEVAAVIKDLQAAMDTLRTPVAGG